MAHGSATLDGLDTPFGDERTTIDVSIEVDEEQPELQRILHRGKVLGFCQRGLHQAYPPLFQELVRRWVRETH